MKVLCCTGTDSLIVIKEECVYLNIYYIKAFYSALSLKIVSC